MPDEARMCQATSTFIQEVAQGGLIRYWLTLGETALLCSMAHFLRHASAQEQEQMTHSLLQVAATYPDCAVRRELIGLYALFRIAIDIERASDSF